MKAMKVSEIMTEKLAMIDSDKTITEAAEMMKKNKCGVLPVGSKNKVVGMITDHDIVTRALAAGKSLDTKISEVMTSNVYTCDMNDSADEAADKMRKHNVGRLVVMNGMNAEGIITMRKLLINKGDELISKDILHELAEYRKAA